MTLRNLLAAAGIIALACSGVRAEEAATQPNPQLGPGVPPFVVRSGLRVTLVAQNLEDARFMEFDDKGTLYLSEPQIKGGKGRILTLKLQDDGTYKPGANFVEGLDGLHGMCFKDGWMWYTQSGAVWKSKVVDGDGKAGETVKVLDGLNSGGHWWRSILVVDDGFYTSIGDPGNATDLEAAQKKQDEKDAADRAAGKTVPVKPSLLDREKIWKYSLDGKTRELFISGIRNTEKLRIRPGTNDIYGCDHGSDEFGAKYGGDATTDLNPPDEFNLYEKGKFYGHPFVVGNRQIRYEYQDRPDIKELSKQTVPPVWCLPAHWAPDGWCFLTKDSALGNRGDAVVGCHGSWNSSVKVGYRVEKIMFDPETGKPYGSLYLTKTMANGAKDEFDRPVDVVEAPDGSLLFTVDSNGGKIFRISAITATAAK